MKELSDKSDQKSLFISIPKLLPKDNVSLPVLMIGRAKLDDISIRSSSQPAVLLSDDGKSRGLNFYLIIAAVFSGVVVQSLLLIYRRRIFKRIGLTPALDDDDRANAAFVFLHSGMLEEAEELLLKALGGAPGPMTISSKALLDGLQGQVDRGLIEVEAAIWWSGTYYSDDHAKATALFARALIRAEIGHADAVSDMTQALKLSPEPVKNYCLLSVHVHRHRNLFEALVPELKDR